jgi:hypothetical protein
LKTLQAKEKRRVRKKQGSDGDYGGPGAVNIGINAGIKTGIEKDQHKEECDEYSNGVT